jgi:hypothetical protein
MGIEVTSLRMLCHARLQGASFADTVTLGRQHLSLRRREIDEALRSMGRAADRVGRYRRAVFADDLLVDLLGIERLVSIDGSDYEGATLVHDMNSPVPDALREAHDAVIDTGTLEHVFNFPVAIANCMSMLRVGGRFYALTPANNHCGHGFYQFSPELFFRVLGAANGFELEHLLAIAHPFPGIELSRRRTVYAVRDPASVGARVGLVSRRPVYLFVQAVKREQVEPFVTYPQQSDYASAWSTAGTRSSRVSPMWRLHRALPFVLRRLLLGIFQRWRRDSFRNTRSYRKWDQKGPPPRV